MLQKNKMVAVVAALFLLAGILALITNYVATKDRLAAAERELAAKQYNDRVLFFAQLFVNKVLKAEGEVSFEDRLRLETAVRGLNDQEITSWWNAFVNAKTEAQAQDAVKNLLGVLVARIKA